jgi:hypothetical protein
VTGPSDSRRFLLTLLFAVWAMAFAYSFHVFAIAAPSGDGFARGLNRVMQFLGWQGVAGVVAVAVFGVSRAWPKGSAVRRMGAVPLFLAGLLVAAILGTILWARM